ncbi:ATP-binding cassette domain-containing protein, partial [Enterococcus faecium]|uniref:ATP-binding cassette domain-containing protein n=1 Tax=Enterococcus faecium TaxID=1352 RepID=UPI003F42BF04
MSASAEAVVVAASLGKTFGPKTALEAVSFAVPPGVICALLGRNGAGKTTLFRLMMGILKPSSGSLAIAGLDAFEDRVALKR